MPKYICRIISNIKKTNVRGIQLCDRDPPLCDYACPIGLLPTELKQLLEMTELVPRLVICAEVFGNHIKAAILGGLATSGKCLQLHNRLPWKPWQLLLEKTHDRCLPRRLRRLIHKCRSLLLLTAVPYFLHIIVITIPCFCVNLAPHGPSKGQSVGLYAQCCCFASQYLQVWFLRYYLHMHVHVWILDFNNFSLMSDCVYDLYFDLDLQFDFDTSNLLRSKFCKSIGAWSWPQLSLSKGYLHIFVWSLIECLTSNVDFLCLIIFWMLTLKKM